MAEAIGTVRVDFKGGTGGLDASADTAASKIEAFGGTATKATGNFASFNFKMLESRKVLGTLAAAAGTTTGPLLHLAYAVGIFGPIIGGAIAGFLLLRQSIAEQKELQDQATASAVRLGNAWKNLTLGNIGAEIAKVRGELLEAIQAQQDYDRSKGLNFGSDMSANISQYRAELERLKGAYQELKSGVHPGGGSGEHHGGGTSHVMKGAHGGELGALRLEHMGHDPNTKILELIAKNTEKLKNPLSMTPALAG